jgi:uncharacterized lipoprotein YmbA
MKYSFFSKWLAALAVLSLSSGGCTPFGSGTTQATRFYVLSSLQTVEPNVQPISRLGDVFIGVGPVEIPDYLNRKEIVLRSLTNEVILSDFAQWAGPLREDFSRAVTENLALLLGTDKVADFPWRAPIPIDYRIVIGLKRFDGQLGGMALLRARWTVLDEKSQEVLLLEHSRIEQPCASDDMNALVAAKSQTVGELSREIAAAVVRLHAERRR